MVTAEKGPSMACQTVSRGRPSLPLAVLTLRDRRNHKGHLHGRPRHFIVMYGEQMKQSIQLYKCHILRQRRSAKCSSSSRVSPPRPTRTTPVPWAPACPASVKRSLLVLARLLDFRPGEHCRRNKRMRNMTSSPAMLCLPGDTASYPW